MPPAVVADDLVGGGEGILNVIPYLQHPEGAMDEENRRTGAAYPVGEFASIDRKGLQTVELGLVGVFVSSHDSFFSTLLRVDQPKDVYRNRPSDAAHNGTYCAGRSASRDSLVLGANTGTGSPFPVDGSEDSIEAPGREAPAVEASAASIDRGARREVLTTP